MLNRKKIAKGVCFILIFLCIFWVCQRVLQAKWIWKIDEKNTDNLTSTWEEYRELEETPVDVLFVGTSHVYSGIDPMYIYGESGITSYVLAGPGLRMDLTYMTIEEGLKTQKPKVVMLDMSAVHWESQQTEAKCHKVTDQMPLSKTKIEFAFDNDNEELKSLDVLFPLLRYHSRWEELGREDIEYLTGDLEETYVRGHFISYKTVTANFQFEKPVEYELTERNREYFERIVELCREKEVPLLLYKIPSPTWYRTMSDGVAVLAEEYGLTYLEPYYDLEEIGLDVNTDFRDENEHLNQYGAEKFCDYMIDYLQEHYELDDQRAENEQWNEDYEQYKTIKQTLLAQNKEQEAGEA